MLAILIVPALWPIALIVQSYIEKSFNKYPGIEFLLYIPGFIWLLFTLGITALIAKLFKLKRTNLLFLITSVCSVFIIAVAISAKSEWDYYQYLIEENETYEFDIVFKLIDRGPYSVAFMILSFITAALFIVIGGYRRLKSKESNAPTKQ